MKYGTTLKTILIGLAMAAVAAVTGWQLFGSWAIALLAGFVLSIVVSVRRADPRVRLQSARQLRYFEASRLFDAVDRLTRRAGLARTPDLYYLRTPLINAATVGDATNASIVVTDGLLAALDEEELEGVLAHEISHVKNGDVRLFRLAEILRQATTLFTRVAWLLSLFALPILLVRGGITPLAILALFAGPTVSWLLQLALLRTREFAADSGAADLTGNPHALARALRKIDVVQRRSFAGLFPPPASPESSLFRTHPTTDERVARLSTMPVHPNGSRWLGFGHPITSR